MLVSIWFSGIMTGVKASKAATMPYWWAKVAKWKGSLPAAAEGIEMGTRARVVSASASGPQWRQPFMRLEEIFGDDPEILLVLRKGQAKIAAKLGEQQQLALA